MEEQTYAILLVEDEEAHQMLIRRAFRKVGTPMHLDVAGDLASARYYLGQKDVDLIISDLNLPDGKGTELLTKPNGERRPTIVMTSFGDEQEAVRALKAGALDYVVKSDYSLSDMPHIAQRAIREWAQMVENRRVSEQLRKLSHAVEQSSSCLMITDTKGKIEYVNPRFTMVTGYTLDECKGRTPSFLRANDSPPIDYASLWQTILSGQSWRGIFRNARKDGEGYWDDTTITPIRDEHGNITHFLGVKEDISDQLRVREEFTLLEAQLRRSQKMQTIGTLAGGIAHDFNNILTPIFGFANMAMEALPVEHQSRQDLVHVIRAAERARDLVRQILTFSRQSDSERNIVQLHLIVKEALKLMRASMPANIEIKSRILSDTRPVKADPSQIHQVVMNLFTNASHAMKERGGVLEVGLRNIKVDADFCRQHTHFKPGDVVSLTVRDTGHGMRPEVLERIFEPFYTTKPVGEGTGLGLSVVHGIIDSHNGEIEVESHEGQGTTFKIYLPVADGPAAEYDGEHKPLARGNGEHVLLVDDEVDIVKMQAQILNMLGYQVTPCPSSVEALESFSKDPNRFDLLITDHSMPGMTGLQLSQSILQLRPKFPIILLSGFLESSHMNTAREIGVAETLIKPIMPADLSLAIRRVLGHESVDA